MDFELSGSHATGAIPSLEHIYIEMKDFAAERRMYLRMTGLAPCKGQRPLEEPQILGGATL